MEMAKLPIFNGKAGKNRGAHNSMQVIFEDEDERSNSRRTSTVDVIRQKCGQTLVRLGLRYRQ